MEKRSSGGEQAWAMLCRVEGAHLWGEGGKLGGSGRGLNTETIQLTLPCSSVLFLSLGGSGWPLYFLKKQQTLC